MQQKTLLSALLVVALMVVGDTKAQTLSGLSMSSAEAGVETRNDRESLNPVVWWSPETLWQNTFWHTCFSQALEQTSPEIGFTSAELPAPPERCGSTAQTSPQAVELVVNPHPSDPRHHPMMEPYIQKALSTMKGRQLRTLQVGLERYATFAADINPIFEKAGLPTWLSGIAMVEANFNPKAKAPSQHAGLWQFSSDTARRYGLLVRGGRDERLEPIRSTEAAVRYLRTLYERYGEWPLALAAYNAGSGRVDRARAGQPDAGLATLVKQGRLPEHTLEVVSRYFAAARVLAQPETYGFRWEAETPSPLVSAVASNP